MAPVLIQGRSAGERSPDDDPYETTFILECGPVSTGTAELSMTAQGEPSSIGRRLTPLQRWLKTNAFLP